MGASDLRIEYVPLSTVQRWPRNPKLHDFDKLDESIKRFGFVQPVMVDERTNRLVAGHGRLETLVRMKASGSPPPVRVKVHNGEWLIPVVRGVEFTDEREAEAYLIADNRLVELGGWDDAALGLLLKDLGGEAQDFVGTGYTLDDLDHLLGGGNTKAGEGAADEEVAVDEKAEPRTQAGDLWLLGGHRLLCGDSTDPAAHTRLMNGAKAKLLATDPPYGVDYTATKNGIPRSGFIDAQAHWGDIENDDLTAETLGKFLGDFLAASTPNLAPGVAVYVWHPSGENSAIFSKALRDAGVLIHRTVIWKKPGFVLTRSGMYHWAHEPCFYGWMEGTQPPWLGEKNQTTVWEEGRDDGKSVHPTQKPVALFEKPMLNHTVRGEICLEPFSGSGSQIIAAERLERLCYAIEKSPRYVDAAVARWEKFTGKTAEKETTP